MARYAPDGTLLSNTNYTGQANYNGVPTPALSVTTPPTNANQINQFGSVNIPQVSPYQGNISDATASTAGVSTFLTEQQKMLQDQLAQANASQQQTRGWLQNLMTSQKSQAQTRQEAFQQIGYDPAQYFAEEKARIAEIGKLTEDYNAVVKARDEQLAATSDKLATNSFINNQQAQINRNAAPKLNAISANVNSKAAVLQALQGNFAEATKFANQAVEDATADYKFKFDTLVTFYNMNKDTIDRLDKKYQDSINTSIQLAQDELNYQRDLNKIKYTQQMQQAYSTKNGGGGIGTGGFADILQQTIDAGGSPEQAAREAAMASEAIGVQVDRATINRWTEEARKLSRTQTQATTEDVQSQPRRQRSQFRFGEGRSFFGEVRAPRIPDFGVRSAETFFSDLFGG